MLPYLPAIAIALLLLLAIPVYAPRAGLAVSTLLLGAAAFFYWKPAATTKFNWGLDQPIAYALLLYTALFIGTAAVGIATESLGGKRRRNGA